MAEITAAAVKQLREKTGAGMMECKNALVEAGGGAGAAIAAELPPGGDVSGGDISSGGAGGGEAQSASMTTQGADNAETESAPDESTESVVAAS